MQNIRIFGGCVLVLFLSMALIPPAVWATEEYKVTVMDLQEHKGLLDDPRPYLKTLSYKKILPSNLYAKLTYDVDKMKRTWEEVIGFKAPDEVGKIAPEIKPGTYSYSEKEKYPGLKELMIGVNYNHFNAGGPPHAGNFPEIKVVPTRQYYHALPIGEATKKNMGATKLGDQGYIIEDTYISGYPFPRPSGKFKANQIIYNWLKRYWGWDSQYIVQESTGYSGSLREDNSLTAEAWMLRLKGRLLTEPYGWYDKRAQKLGEDRIFSFKFMSPRDMFGNVINSIKYLDPDKFDQMLLYVNVMRRVRVMSATDLQDVVGGTDVIYADSEVFSQNLSKTNFPYKCEVIAEREYLLPVTPLDGSAYLSSAGLELRDYEWERRPVYVIKMTQLDKNFVYSKRILYIDKETFMLRFIENYDQKGRLYRTSVSMLSFAPEMGIYLYGDNMVLDHVDLHSSWVRTFLTPAPWVNRKNVGLRSLIRKGK